MSEKILFSDMDGTLLTSEKLVSPSMHRLLTKMVQSGNRLVLSSGRSLASILKAAKRADLLFPDTLIIAANGNEIYDYDGGTFLLQKTVPLDIAQKIIDLAHELGIHIQSYTSTHVVCEKEDAEWAHYQKRTATEAVFSDDILKTVGHAPFKLLAINLESRKNLAVLQQQVLQLYGDVVTAIFSCDEYLEIFDKTAGKGNAIRFVCDHFNIPLSNAVAAGDAENDISMLDIAGVGVAMANADPEVKKHADFITQRDNDHDGLAEAILHFFDL